MGRESFRFIHASDFHLESPLRDLPDLPDHLRQSLVDAPWKAAESVFEHALVEAVDFVILSGDLVNPIASGALGPAFLLEQFQRLHEQGIAVYWAGGFADDIDRWPHAVSLPPNVFRFEKKVGSITHRRAGMGIATLVGRSCDGRQIIRATEYSQEADDCFHIAVGYGEADDDSLSGEKFDYWALGGKHQRRSMRKDERPIWYSGSPQGRSLDEPGGHGFCLVEVDSQQRCTVHPVDVDVFRYFDVQIDEADLVVGRDLRQVMTKRLHRIQQESSGRHALVRWRVQLDLENATVVGPAAIEEMLVWLRREFGYGQPSTWSIDIEVIPPKSLPKKWQEEDTILGDFLRTVAEQRKSGNKPFDLEGYVETETPGGAGWKATLLPVDNKQMNSLLDLSTLLGVDLLRGHNVDLLACTRRFGKLNSGDV